MRSRADSGLWPEGSLASTRAAAPRSPHKARAARAAVRSEATIQLGKSSLSPARVHELLGHHFQLGSQGR